MRGGEDGGTERVRGREEDGGCGGKILAEEGGM